MNFHKIFHSLYEVNFLLNAHQLALEILFTLNRLLNVLIESIKIDLRNFRVCRTNRSRLTRLRLPSIGQEKLQSRHNATVSFLPRIFHNIDTKLHNVTAADLEWL
jgi:hypothetical protein